MNHNKYFYLYFLQDGTTSFLTNFFKLALLPAESFSLAVEVVVAYEEGELSPPSEAHQRQRRKITSSTLNFLVGLDPLKEKDAVEIRQKFLSWKETGIRPCRECPRESGNSKAASISNNAQTSDLGTSGTKKDLIKQLEDAKKKLKEQAQNATKQCAEISLLEKQLSKAEEESKSVAQKCDHLLKELEELKAKENVALAKKRGPQEEANANRTVPQKEDHAAFAEELSTLRQAASKSKDAQTSAASKSKDAQTSAASTSKSGETSAASKSKNAQTSAASKSKDAQTSAASKSKDAQTSAASTSKSGETSKTVKGWSYIDASQFEAKNIFQQVATKSRLRERK